MDKHITLKSLVFAYIIIGITVITSEFYLQAFLDIPLQEYIEAELSKELTTVLVIVSITTLIVFITQIVSLLALLWRKKWAFNTFIFSTPILVLLSFFGETFIQHQITYALDHLSTLIMGGLMVFLLLNKEWYITNASRKSDT